MQNQEDLIDQGPPEVTLNAYHLDEDSASSESIHESIRVDPYQDSVEAGSLIKLDNLLVEQSLNKVDESKSGPSNIC